MVIPTNPGFNFIKHGKHCYFIGHDFSRVVCHLRGIGVQNHNGCRTEKIIAKTYKKLYQLKKLRYIRNDWLCNQRFGPIPKK